MEHRASDQIPLTDKTETLKLRIQLEPILPQWPVVEKDDDTSCSLTGVLGRVRTPKKLLRVLTLFMAPGLGLSDELVLFEQV